MRTLEIQTYTTTNIIMYSVVKSNSLKTNENQESHVFTEAKYPKYNEKHWAASLYYIYAVSVSSKSVYLTVIYLG